MNKTKSFAKYLKNISNLINSLLERNLNKLNFKNISYLFKNNKIILTIVALFVLCITYLSIPNFYQQSDIFKKLQTELKAKFGINIKFSKSIKYNFFPSPHFITTDSRIIDNQNEISKIKKLKIFISYKDLFSLKNIKIQDLNFENANFYLTKKNYNFFLNLFNKNFKDGSLVIKNSNIFFKNLENEVLFINKILKMKYYYEKKELKNIFYSENEIFKIPFSIESFLNKNKNKVYSKINLNLMQMKIENELSIKDEKKAGKSEFVLNKLKRIIEYQVDKNSFNFHIFDKREEPNITYKGKINLKPFYATLKGDLDKINLKYFFETNAIIVQLLKTEIFNHKNIDFKLNIDAENAYNNSNFKNIYFESKIQDGLIDTDNTKFKWKDFADFELLDTLVFVRDGDLVLDGKLKIKINDYKKVYKFLVTPKKYRDKIEQIDLNFTYNFDKKVAKLKDIQIDSKINQKVNKILNDVILKKNNFQNKIYFKNLLNEAIKSYSG